jgi:hypothetical protein
VNYFTERSYTLAGVFCFGGSAVFRRLEIDSCIIKNKQITGKSSTNKSLARVLP